MPGVRQGAAFLAVALAAANVPARAASPTGPLTLPETLRGTVEGPGAGQGMAQGADAPIDTLKGLYPALAACWIVPEGLARFERTEITARFALRRDGSVIGTPRITFATEGGDGRARALLAEAAIAAIRRCTPARVTPTLGAAIAGRPIALRFIHLGPRGQGI